MLVWKVKYITFFCALVRASCLSISHKGCDAIYFFNKSIIITSSDYAFIVYVNNIVAHHFAKTNFSEWSKNFTDKVYIFSGTSQSRKGTNNLQGIKEKEGFFSASLRKRMAVTFFASLWKRYAVTNPRVLITSLSNAKEQPCGCSFCGKRGIRTPGGVTLVGFQDRCNRPLCHLSSYVLQS